MAKYDFIVVGSGSGGGALAYYLHNTGAKVLLLEAGRMYRKDTFPKTEAEATAHLYWGGGIEFDKDARMGFLRTRLVGGSSIAYQCLMDRFDDIAFNDWKDESGVSWFNSQEFEKHYAQVESDLALHTFSAPERTRNAQLFSEACDKLNYKWSFLRRGQSDCATDRGNDCLACLGGCHRDSKQSSLVAFVQKAEKTGLEIATEIEIGQIEHKKDGVILKGFKGLLGTKTPVTFEGAKVILCGGSFGSTKMMLQSGFKSKLPALGKYFASHPQFMWFGVQKDPVDAHKGGFQSVASKDPNFRKEGFKLENVFGPPISVGMLFDVQGRKHLEYMKKYRHLQCIEVAVRDENIGEISVDKKGKLIVNKPLTDQDIARKNKGLTAIKNILKAADAVDVLEAPFYFGLHLMGGCVMGVDPNRSVVDPEFRVHGMENLYIADSSIYPNAPGINPSLTIMALAHRLSQQITR